tara:strand:- start:330 stop:1280 length:951 start_codon:yes stop_codon:yes gene_type:complete
MKIVYVTGCLGFIGSYVTRKCLEKGWMVYGIDKCTYAANTDLIQEFSKHPNFKFERADIKDLDHLYDCDYVINTAAESHVANSIISSEKFLETNVLGTQNLLELIRSKQKNVGKRPIFLHFSTDEVYGDIINGDHSEEDLLKPSNPYSASKAAADMLVLAWARTYDLSYVIVRPANNYGIGQYPEKLIPLTVKNLNRGRKTFLHNKGEPYRCWLHADDTAEAVMKIIESGKLNEIYNISGHEEQRNIDTVKNIIKCYGYDVGELDKYVDLSYSRQGQDVRYSVNDRKLQSLGWLTKKKFDKEIISIVKYYKKRFIW